VQLTSSPRRALGLLAAGTIGLSTVLLGVTGVAQAAPGDATEAPVESPADPEVQATLNAPYAPTMIDVQGSDTTLGVWFDWTEGDDDTDWADEFEYNLNGGTWLPLDPDYSSGYAFFEATGLTNGTAYAVRVRGVSDSSGAGTASDPMSGTPYKPIGAPGAPTVVVGPSSLKVSWTAPTTAGTYPIAGYVVSIPVSHGQSGGPESICETDAATTTCTFGVPAGVSHDVFVNAVDNQDHDGDWTDPVASGVVPAPTVPAPVPAKNGDLALAAGSSSTVAPGKTVTVTGTGYAPGSSVSVVIYSTPQVLTTIIADASGNFSVQVTIPAGLAAGSHTLVASGVDASGVLRYVTLPVTVTSSGTAALAYTGADVGLPAIGGLVAVAVGAGLLVARRRSNAAAASAA
jgi:titin